MPEIANKKNMNFIGFGAKPDSQANGSQTGPLVATIRSRMKVCRDLAKDISSPGQDVKDLLDISWSIILRDFERDLVNTPEPSEAQKAKGSEEGKKKVAIKTPKTPVKGKVKDNAKDAFLAVETGEEASQEERQKDLAKALYSKLTHNLAIYEKIVPVFADVLQMIGQSTSSGSLPAGMATSVRNFDKCFRVMKELHSELINFLKPHCAALGGLEEVPEGAASQDITEITGILPQFVGNDLGLQQMEEEELLTSTTTSSLETDENDIVQG